MINNSIRTCLYRYTYIGRVELVRDDDGVTLSNLEIDLLGCDGVRAVGVVEVRQDGHGRGEDVHVRVVDPARPVSEQDLNNNVAKHTRAGRPARAGSCGTSR